MAIVNPNVNGLNSPIKRHREAGWNIHRTSNPTAAEYTFFSSAQGTFSRIDYMIGDKSNFSKFKKIEIIPTVFSDHMV